MFYPQMKVVIGGALFGGALLFSGCTTEVIEEAPETSPATTTSPAPSGQHGGGAAGSPAPAPGPAPGPAQTTVPMMPNPNGDGSMVPCEGTICTNPNHGAGDDPAENGGLMEDPDGSGDLVPCEGTICTNPNHGAGDEGDAPPEPGQTEMEGPDDGTEG